MVNESENTYIADESVGKEILPNSIHEHLYGGALEDESFEKTSETLAEVEALQNFRKAFANFKFNGFSEVIESVTNVRKSNFPRKDKEAVVREVVESARGRAQNYSPRVADFFLAILSELDGSSYQTQFELTWEKIAELKECQDLEILFSGESSWDIKFNRIQTRLADYLAGLRTLDKRDGAEMSDDIRNWRIDELRKAGSYPVSRSNESKPGVDPMERLKEGETALPIWIIKPAWGGIFKEQTFSKWDSVRNVWTEDGYAYEDVVAVPLSGNHDHRRGPIDVILNAVIPAGSWMSIPLPYTHSFHKVESNAKKCEVKADQNGDLVLRVETKGIETADIIVYLAPDPNKKARHKGLEAPKAPRMPSVFSQETENKLKEAARQPGGNIKRAKVLRNYVISRIKYLAPKDRAEAERYNSIYRGDPKGFAGAVDEVRAGDCDVVNTYFAALCSKIGIPVRHSVGHSVKGRDENGNSRIHSGTGHGWSEIWDEANSEWIRMDATPAGDPNLEREDADSSNRDYVPGDYGDNPAIRPSDEDLENLRKKLSAHKEKLSFTREERNLAEKAGVELSEARKIVKEIAEAEKSRLPDGELVIDALSRVFNAIVESRKVAISVYDGPARKREGGEAIEDIVRHQIAIIGGETDPATREVIVSEEQEEKHIGGFDIYLIGDKSGSMQREDESGAKLWEIQRRAEYLIFSSLYRFNNNLKRAELQKSHELSIRSQGISFRGNSLEEIDLDKPLSAEFSALDKVKIWHSLTEQGMGNGDAAALGYVFNQIKKEIEEIEKRGRKDNRLRVVIACSDGGYVDEEAKMRDLAAELGKLKAVVIGLGLTESAASVPVVLNNPPYSRGDIIKNVNDLPAVVAKNVISEAIKLFPAKSRAEAEKIISGTLAKFKF